MAVKDALILHPMPSGGASAETATGNTNDYGQFASFARAVFYLDVSAFSGFTGVAITIQERNPRITGQYYDVVTFTSVTAVSNQRAVLDPCLGTLYRVRWVVTGTGSITFTVLAVMGTEEAIP